MYLHPLPEEHRDTYREFISYAFSPEDGPDWDDTSPPDADIYYPRGLYDTSADVSADALDSSDLVAVCAFYDFTARARGTWHPLPGISVVASPPEARRQGHIATMLDELLVEFRDSGRYLSALWPFKYEFYRRFGWAKTNDYAKTTVPPEALTAVSPDVSGEFVRLGPDDWERLDAVYTEWATEDLGLDRTEGWWRNRTFRWWGSNPYVYGWERDGDLRGYVVYRMDGDWNERTMHVSELASVDAEARGHLLRFLRDHDSQVEEVVIQREHERTRLIDDLTDPLAATVEIKPGPMVRIVDVSAALEAVTFSADADTDVVLGVSDDRCAWNDDTFRVVVTGGEASVEPATDDPDATVEIGGLSQLLVGARSADELARTESLTIHEPAALDGLAEVFTERDTFLRERF
ncbi:MULTISPECIES: enhanced intracellular survival protein Eis [Haloferax]|uniref:GNAT family N-acetyltransferase n=1 Tax=Haloferax marinum TaxID=2666143 RepID=A0A6A8G8I6_9EURY|nr:MULTISPECIES: GNAT family N-acetyltransferase [Haloferax]KAB1198369.1 GNAT family N-acetyltransferase [Haloferax sp. CBA1150]MRW97469.1 GNAT family N-acetyltransferase [Haloferax marinum]